MFNIACKKQIKQDIILPNNYKGGWFAIVYNCDCGNEKVIKNDRVQQFIPQNRVLLVRYPRNEGKLDIRFFYEKDSKMKLITTINDNIETPSNDSVTLLSRFSRLSFNGISICSKNKKSFHEHEVVMYNFTEGKATDEPEITIFTNKLIEYLKKK